jgi:hypothetical protein
MGTRRQIGLAGRCIASAVGLAAGSYAAFVATAWCRYGKAIRQLNGEDRDALLDQFMPMYEIAERHHVRVAAPADISFETATEIDFQQSSIVRGIFKTREWIMRSHAASKPEVPGFLSQMRALGWGVLAEVPGREVVMGAVTQPWMADVVFRPLQPDAFAGFHEPGYVKIVWTLRADPLGDTESIFRTETRVVATDPIARAKFRMYWAFASPGIILIRWALLGPLKREAERRVAAVAYR